MYLVIFLIVQLKPCPSINYLKPRPSGIPDTLQWDPQVLHEDVTEGYLVRVNSMLQERAGLPSGSTHRDNELALRTLQSCDHNTDKAVDMFREDTPHEYGGCGLSGH